MNEQVLDAMREMIDDIGAGRCPCCGRNLGDGQAHVPDCAVPVVDAYLATLDADKGEGKAVRARFAVVTIGNGQWCAKGSSWHQDEEAMEDAHDYLWNERGYRNEPVEKCFIEADIPLPKPVEPQTIEGKVKGQNDEEA